MTDKVKPEDIYHHGIKYSDYKGVIKIIGPDGELKIEFTTYRADIITDIMRAGMALQAFEPGDTLTIVAGPNEKMVAKNDWVRVAGKGSEAFKVIGVEGNTAILHTGITEPLEKVETLDEEKYEISSYIVHTWCEKE